MTSLRVTPRPRLTAVRAAWLFDGESSTVFADPVVVLDGGTIRSVVFGSGPPEGIDVTDLRGATLLPGLIDTHVHLVFDSSADPATALADRTDDEVVLAMRSAARTALLGGVTTVRDLGDRSYLSLGLRNDPDLPTIVAAGPPITTPSGHCHFLGGGVEPTEAGVTAAVREHIERGVDVLKIMASGGTMTPGTRQELAQFPAAVLQAAVDEAHRHGFPVTAHAHGTQAIRDAIDAGVDGVEHASFWSADGVDEPGDLLEILARRRIPVGATLGLVPVPGGVPPLDIVRRMPAMMANLGQLLAAGAVVVAASDAGIAPVKPPDACRYALRELQTLGVTSAEALRTVTSVAARVCGLTARKGRIVAGYDADLLAVEGNPLTDPEAIHRIRAVYRGGRAVRSAAPTSLT